MDKVTDAKTDFRLKQWTKIIQACQTSGMTVAAWCSQNNVKIKSYYYWLRKLRIIACQAAELPALSDEQPIVPLEFKQSKPSERVVITVHLSSISIDIQNGASRETIEAVLSALKNLC